MFVLAIFQKAHYILSCLSNCQEMKDFNAFEMIRNIQKSQNFDGFESSTCKEFNFDQLQLFPNQIAYKVDCQHAEITKVKGNIKSIFNIEKLKSIDQIYELIRPSSLNKFVNETEDNFRFIQKDPKRTEPYRNVFSSIYELKRVGTGYFPFIRQCFVTRSDQNGVFTHTAGIYTLLPQIPKAKLNTSETYQVLGPDSIYYNNEHLSEFKFLSERELQVLKLISEGFKTTAISEKLFLSKLTVDTHRKNIINKLEAHNTPHVVAIAKDIGLI